MITRGLGINQNLILQGFSSGTVLEYLKEIVVKSSLICSALCLKSFCVLALCKTAIINVVYNEDSLTGYENNQVSKIVTEQNDNSVIFD